MKKRPYKLAHKYKETVKKEIDNMLAAGIIYPIDQSEWENPMDVQPKKHDPTKLRICVNFRELNKVTLTDPFPTPYADKIFNEIVGHECYSFTYGFSGYNQVLIVGTSCLPLVHSSTKTPTEFPINTGPPKDHSPQFIQRENQNIQSNES